MQKTTKPHKHVTIIEDPQKSFLKNEINNTYDLLKKFVETREMYIEHNDYYYEYIWSEESWYFADMKLAKIEKFNDKIGITTNSKNAPIIKALILDFVQTYDIKINFIIEVKDG